MTTVFVLQAFSGIYNTVLSQTDQAKKVFETTEEAVPRGWALGMKL